MYEKAVSIDVAAATQPRNVAGYSSQVDNALDRLEEIVNNLTERLDPVMRKDDRPTDSIPANEVSGVLSFVEQRLVTHEYRVNIVCRRLEDLLVRCAL